MLQAKHWRSFQSAILIYENTSLHKEINWKVNWYYVYTTTCSKTLFSADLYKRFFMYLFRHGWMASIFRSFSMRFQFNTDNPYIYKMCLFFRKKAADDRMEVHYRDGKIVLPDGVTGINELFFYEHAVTLRSVL